MNEWLKTFKWDSDQQRDGYLSFLKWAREKNASTEFHPIDAFFIQKDHDSHLYWTDLVAGQVRALQDQLIALKNDIAELHGLIVELRDGKPRNQEGN